MSDPLFVAVLGGGNGAFITAADLKLKGHRVNLCEISTLAENIEEVAKTGGINLDVVGRPGLNTGFAKLDRVTTDFGQAVKGVDVVLIVVPAFAQKLFAKACSPFLEDGQIVILSPGNFGGAIEFRRIFKKSGNQNRIVVAETECMIYSGFKDSPTSAWVSGYKKGLRIAAFPARDTDEAFEVATRLYPDLQRADNVLETGLQNINTIVHAPITVLNAGWIEKTNGGFLFYWDGCTPSIGAVIEQVEDERVKIGKAFSLKLTPVTDMSLKWYGHEGAKGDNIFEILSTNPAYEKDAAPSKLNHRFLLEDIPYGMTALESLGRIAGIPTPITTAIINISSALLRCDLRQESRDLVSLELDWMNDQELLKFLLEEEYD